jgi:hypothetical protein
MGCDLKSNPEMKSSIEDQFVNFSVDILELKLSRPALRALIREELWTIELVKQKGEKYVSGLHGVGKTAINKLFI